MSTTTLLLQPPTNSTPSHTHTLSQQAPSYLKSQSPGLTLPWPLSLLTTSESQEKWQIHENLALASLRANDLTTAEKALKALDSRFGLENERVAALRGLHAEATAKNESELQQVMEHYEEILKEDPACFAIRKRRIALLRSQGKISEAVGALVNFLDSNPTDAEAWSEMAEMYVQTGAWEQAIFALEEVLLLVPNAWNVHARMGEVVYMSGAAGRGGEELVKSLAESMRRFCRSVELCDGYLRGYFGLKVTTDRLLKALGERKSVTIDANAGELPLPSVEKVKKLNQLATAQLAEITRKSAAGDKGCDGYSEAELKAARDLLAQETQQIAR